MFSKLELSSNPEGWTETNYEIIKRWDYYFDYIYHYILMLLAITCLFFPMDFIYKVIPICSVPLMLIRIKKKVANDKEDLTKFIKLIEKIVPE